MNSALRQVLLLAVNDVRLVAKDRLAFVWMLLIPLAMMWLFGNVFGGGDGAQEPPALTLAVDDRDGGWVARALVEDLEESGIETREAGAGAGATLVLPAGLTAGVEAGEPQVVRLVADPDAGMEQGMGAEIYVRRALVRTVGRLLVLKFLPAGEEGLPARYAGLAAQKPRFGLEVTTAGSGTPVPSGFALSVPGILTMTVLMMTLMFGAISLILEKRQGMLRRQMSLPLSRGQLVLGKLLGRLVIAGLQIAVLLVLGRLLFGLTLGHSPLGLALVVTGYAVAVGGLSMLLGAVLRTAEQASSIGWVLSMVLSTLGGCFFPQEIMPEWLKTASLALPTAWAMKGFHALISYGHGVEGVWVSALVLFGFGALFTALAARFLRDV